MNSRHRFLLACGLASAALVLGSSLILGALLPGYDPVVQTLSELGETGSPFERTFRLVTLANGACLLLFARGLFLYASRAGLARLPAVLLGLYGVTELGIATFPSPHPWHNAFGLLSTPGFLAPLAVALGWRGPPALRGLRGVSGAVFVVVLAAMALNLSPMVHPYPFVTGHYGVFQRLLFFPFYLWLAFLATTLLRTTTGSGWRTPAAQAQNGGR